MCVNMREADSNRMKPNPIFINTNLGKIGGWATHDTGLGTTRVTKKRPSQGHVFSIAQKSQHLTPIFMIS